ncbi:hypothetical protein ANCDUO_23426 [Ancylostoma duodenale]|uniref:Uncharacterized protein n=1 Tax=Ancylostoma duodenale TaxID=51022 RepID=A0A0C2FNS6_9BILA|nr:hypothetical protein ANCDUO_23426 [Ancylostoma duodenale]
MLMLSLKLLMIWRTYRRVFSASCETS